ncbi:MAG: tripartite tricarboxylate transporter substrate binding protein [Proteobacteria bacterium]|nr:tripartite tricarboxylate transporter substrate binding protein [Burkholderiales bacterium]
MLCRVPPEVERIRALSLVLLSALAVAASGAVAADKVAAAYPIKPIRVIVPFPPGGGTDFVMRAIAPQLSEQLGQQVLIDNRAGAQGVIGTQLGARASNDGYTLTIVDAATVISPALIDPPPFDVLKDFAPIAILVEQPYLITLHPSVPATSMAEFIKLVQANPNKYNFGSGSAIAHVSQALFYSVAKLNMTHVPYRGSGPLMAALIGNEVQTSFTGPGAALPQVKAGKLRAIAVTSIKRFAQTPEVPTLDEVGFKGFEIRGWFGMLAPAGTPRPIVVKLNGALNNVLSGGQAAQLLRERGYDLNPASPEAFGKFLGTEVTRWSKAVKQYGVKASD